MGTLEEPFKQLGESFNKLPHLVIGQDRSNNQNVPQKPLFDEHESKVLNNIKKWGIIAAVTLVIVYATYRIFFG